MIDTCPENFTLTSEEIKSINKKFEKIKSGVSKSRYFGISIPIKYSNFSRFYKKMGQFYKKFRCDKFGN